MSEDRDRRDWAIARVLFGDHLPFLLIMWVAFAAVVAAVTAGIAVFGTVSASIWDPAGTFLRWLALGYGGHLVATRLPSYVAHGRTRREFLLQATVFVVVAVVLLAVLTALGHLLEAAVYRALDWPWEVSPGGLYTSSGQFPLIVVTFVVLFAVWTVAGGLLAAAFTRDDGSLLLAIPLALVMVVLAGASVGYGGLPFVGRLVAAGPPSALTVALSAGAFLLGVAAVWALARDLPIRTRPR